VSDKVAREYLQAAGGDMRMALYALAHAVEMARLRVEDALPQKGMNERELALLWKDLHKRGADA